MVETSYDRRQGDPFVTHRYLKGENFAGFPYKVVHMIGEGGMGAVYEVIDESVDLRYVAKTIHPDLVKDEGLIARFFQEAKVLAKVRHPHIVQIITCGRTKDRHEVPFFIMEHLDGLTLHELLHDRGNLSAKHAYQVITELLDALGHAHEHGIVHRDVKPENIFCVTKPTGGEAEIKLLDFGIMGFANTGASPRLTGGFKGTARYASPEQFRCEAPTAQTDLYAATLVAYECLAGRGPFDGKRRTLEEWARAHLEETPRPISDFVNVPGVIDALFTAGLAKDPAKRPSSARAFSAQLFELQWAFHEKLPNINDTDENLVTAFTNARENQDQKRLSAAATSEARAEAAGPAVTAPNRPRTVVEEKPQYRPLEGNTLEDAFPPANMTAPPANPDPSPSWDQWKNRGGIDRKAKTTTARPDPPPRKPMNDTEPLPIDFMAMLEERNRAKEDLVAKSEERSSNDAATPSLDATAQSVGKSLSFGAKRVHRSYPA